MTFRVFNAPLARYFYKLGFKPRLIIANGSGVTVQFEDREDREKVLERYQEIKRRRFIDGKHNRYSNTG